MRTTELAIVGAGAAGLSAAAEAARHGVSVVVFDDNPRPHRGARERFSDTLPGVALLDGAVVWGAPEAKTLAFTHAGHADRVRAEAIIVAAGAVERAVPFPGWTLPGVMAAGEARNLIETGAVRSGLRALVVGTGPLVPVLAQALRRAGVAIAAALEVAVRGQGRRALPGLAAARLPLPGIAYRAPSARARIPLRRGWTVIEARGGDRVSEALVAPIDPAGRVDRTRARPIRVDTIVTGFGRAPATELTRLLGCAHEWHPARGGWIPSRSADLETSVQGVFAVGDGAGIAGAETALLEGRLTGLLSAARLGRCPPSEARAADRGLRARLGRLVRFRTGIDALYTPPRDFLSLLTPETIVCPCEGVTAGQLVSGLGRGLTSINALKGATRITMGICQGRHCLGTLADLVARERGCGPADLVYPQARPPARPVRVGDLIAEDISPAAPLAVTPP